MIHLKWGVLYSMRGNILNVIEYFEYNSFVPSCLVWKKVKRYSKSKVGEMAGSLDTSKGYWVLNLSEGKFSCHRIVWALHFGEIKDGHVIDHIDRDSTNNKIENLRSIPAEMNARNTVKNRTHFSTDKCGVSYSERNIDGVIYAKYTATACFNGKKKQNSFSVNKYGNELAKTLAFCARDAMIAELNKMGYGYTEHHGSIRSTENVGD